MSSWRCGHSSIHRLTERSYKFNVQCCQINQAFAIQIQIQPKLWNLCVIIIIQPKYAKIRWNKKIRNKWTTFINFRTYIHSTCAAPSCCYRFFVLSLPSFSKLWWILRPLLSLYIYHFQFSFDSEEEITREFAWREPYAAKQSHNFFSATPGR